MPGGGGRKGMMEHLHGRYEGAKTFDKRRVKLNKQKQLVTLTQTLS